jgi:hypothetical protein
VAWNVHRRIIAATSRMAIQLDSSIECVRCEMLSNGRRRHLRSNGHTLYGSSKSDHFARDERCGGAVLMSGLAHLLILDRHVLIPESGFRPRETHRFRNRFNESAHVVLCVRVERLSN